jgi:outer membrane protein assembly factor BamE (lipoprotein component of BamABCDE complex)
MTSNAFHFRPWLRILAIGGLLVLAACGSRITVNGNAPDPDLLAEVKPGQVGRDDVRDILGSPSAIATFDQENWYYISQKTETVAFFKPEVLERRVVIVRFNKDGIVSKVHNLTLADGKDVQFVERETPTTGSEYGLLQQLFGNIGRFNPGGQEAQ